MTKDQILAKALRRVFGNVQVDFSTEGIEITEKLGRDGFHNFVLDYADKGYYGVIFSHEFAKAFWGSDDLLCPAGESYGDCLCDISWEEAVEPWRYHLGKMVLEEEPLEYLKKFL